MFHLPKLSFNYDDLEPHIDSRTMKIHHSKHHQGYIDKLNLALSNLPELQSYSVEDILTNLDKIPVTKKDLVRNNGGGHVNHSLFWSILKPNGEKLKSESKLKLQINNDFGSLENCINEVSEAAITHFGSGWGWLVLNGNKLEAVSTSNQNSPLLYNMNPLLGIDVWEHAYYLNYQNKRAEYVEQIWNVINWSEVEKRYLKVIS